MMHRIKYSKSLVESGGMIKNGLSVLLLLLKSQKGLVPSPERLGSVSSGFSSAAAAAAAIGESSSLMKMDMFRARDIPNLFRGRQIGGCVASFAPHQCNKSHMLPYFARTLASSSASKSSGQTPRQFQESEKKKKECQLIRSSELQRERCDEISSTEVSLNQFPGLMVAGNVWDSKTRRLLRLKPETGYFEEEQDVSAAASDHRGHYALQVPNEHMCRGSAYGWLLVIDDYLNMKLFNPFSGAEIQLPPATTLPLLKKEEGLYVANKWSVTKAVFSANPSIEPRPIVLVIYILRSGKVRLAFCKPGDKGWTPLEFSKWWLFVDAIYHEGQFYVLGWSRFVVAFDIGRCINDDDHSVKTNIIANPPHSGVGLQTLYMIDFVFERRMRNVFLAMLDGDLVKFELRSVSFHGSRIEKTKKVLERDMNRDGDTSDEDIYNGDDEEKVTVVDPHLYCVDPRSPSCTYSIKIRRFDASENRWVKVESLGDKAVFLGFNTSFAISASDYPAGVCIPDSVYFIDMCGTATHMVEVPYYDMGIYNVKDKCLKPLCRPDDISEIPKPAPIWIVNSGR